MGDSRPLRLISSLEELFPYHTVYAGAYFGKRSYCYISLISRFELAVERKIMTSPRAAIVSISYLLHECLAEQSIPQYAECCQGCSSSRRMVSYHVLNFNAP
eukprot:6173677-Pleurochrysis_carterae.AAC.1